MLYHRSHFSKASNRNTEASMIQGISQENSKAEQKKKRVGFFFFFSDEHALFQPSTRNYFTLRQGTHSSPCPFKSVKKVLMIQWIEYYYTGVRRCFNQEEYANSRCFGGSRAKAKSPVIEECREWWSEFEGAGLGGRQAISRCAMFMLSIGHIEVTAMLLLLLLFGLSWYCHCGEVTRTLGCICWALFLSSV